MVREAGSEAPPAELARWTDGAVTSTPGRVETTRAAIRESESPERIETVLTGLTVVAVSEPVVQQAALLPSPEMRSLDALHLATALPLGRQLGALFSYEARLLHAAAAAGLTLASPGRPGLVEEARLTAGKGDPGVPARPSP